MSDIGHNSGNTDDRVKQFVSRIERLEEEKRALTADIAEVYKEAKSDGHNVKIMRKVIALRKLSEADRQEQQALIDTYMRALGMLGDTPLGRAALRAVS